MTTQFEERFLPFIPWREPIAVKVAGKDEKIACRFCMARKGLKASEIEMVPYAFDDIAAWQAHMDKEHPQ